MFGTISFLLIFYMKVSQCDNKIEFIHVNINFTLIKKSSTFILC